MNGIEKITERIAQDARQECAAIESRGKSQAAEIRAGYTALAEADYAEAVSKGRKDAAERIERMESVSQLEARQRRLAAKQEMLDKAFDLALEKLLNLPEAQYVELLCSLALRASTTGQEALVFSVQDRPRFGKKVVQAANAALEQEGKTAGLTLSEESRDFTGGLYVQDGKVETNCTFRTLVRILREQMAAEVAGILFDSNP